MLLIFRHFLEFSQIEKPGQGLVVMYHDCEKECVVIFFGP